jgi:hypothetical protein
MSISQIHMVCFPQMGCRGKAGSRKVSCTPDHGPKSSETQHIHSLAVVPTGHHRDIKLRIM